MINYSMTTLSDAGSQGIHFQMQGHRKAHVSTMELSISACEGSRVTALLTVHLHPAVLIC